MWVHKKVGKIPKSQNIVLLLTAQEKEEELWKSTVIMNESGVLFCYICTLYVGSYDGHCSVKVITNPLRS